MLNQQLLQALGSNLNANHARLKNLCLLVSAVLLHRTVNLSTKGSVHASEHFFKLENETFGFRIGSSLAYVAVD